MTQPNPLMDPLRRFRLAPVLGACLLLAACGGRSLLSSVLPGASAAPKPVAQVVAPVKAEVPTLWERIAALEQQAPYPVAGVERALGVSLAPYPEPSNPLYAFYRAPEVVLGDGELITNVDLRIRKGTTQPGFLVLELDGPCVPLADVQARFGNLEAVASPRGQAAQEARVYGAQRAWGRISFGFQEQEPDCLALVIFNTAPGQPGTAGTPAAAPP